MKTKIMKLVLNNQKKENLQLNKFLKKELKIKKLFLKKTPFHLQIKI